MPENKPKTPFNSRYSHDFAGYLLLFLSGRDIFLIVASGELNVTDIISAIILFILATLVLHDNALAKVIALITALAGLVFVFFASDTGEVYSATWYEDLSIQFLFSVSLILLLVGHRNNTAFIFGSILGAIYIIYLALVVFVRFNV